MNLKSIEISGFKSFVKRETLDFKHQITAIVGPNGSGKSNITEAFRFVLGEQSIKSMRGKRGEDLIWNGSATMPRVNKASVKIVFDNRRRILNVDFDEAILERKVFRDGENQYFLNDSQVRLRDIIELLAPAHIGASGHHIISQGEADKILNANIKDRKSMIEDALGLKIYQYKKQESQKKLQKTEENIKQAESLRKELSPHIKFLKKQFEKLQKSREMKTELLKLCLEYFADEKFFLEKEKEEIEEKLTVPQSKLKELERLLEKSIATLKNPTRKEKQNKLVQEENKLRSLRDEKGTLIRNLGRIEGQISIWQENLKSREARDVAINSESVKKLRQKLAEEISLVEKSFDLELAKSVLRKVLSEIDEILENKSSVEEQKFSQSLENLKEEKRSLENHLAKISQEEKNQLISIEKLQKEIEMEKDANQEAEKSILKIQAERNELLSELSVLNSRKREREMTRDDFERELKEIGVLVGEIPLDFGIKASQSSRELQRERRKNIERLKIRLEDAGGLGEEVEKEYQEITERDRFLSNELEDLAKSAKSLEDVIAELEERLNSSFKEGVEKINKEFQNFFSLMFEGGSARLEIIREKKRRKISEEDLEEFSGEKLALLEDEKEAEEGMDIRVSLPRKKIKGLEMLSGGERALTSIALIFAVSQVTPPPFLILDETDAALDEANSKRYGDMLKALSSISQLILITHNRETMSRAGIIYGITMGKEGFSKVLSVDFEEAVSVAK